MIDSDTHRDSQVDKAIPDDLMSGYSEQELKTTNSLTPVDVTTVPSESKVDSGAVEPIDAGVDDLQEEAEADDDSPPERYIGLVGKRLVKIFPGNEMMGAIIQKIFKNKDKWVFRILFDNGFEDVSSADAVRKLHKATNDEGRLRRFEEWLTTNVVRPIGSIGGRNNNTSRSNLNANKDALDVNSTQDGDEDESILQGLKQPRTSKRTESRDLLAQRERALVTLQDKPPSTSTATLAQEGISVGKGYIALHNGLIVKACFKCRACHTGLQRCRIHKRHSAPNWDDPSGPDIIFPAEMCKFFISSEVDASSPNNEEESGSGEDMEDGDNPVDNVVGVERVATSRQRKRSRRSRDSYSATSRAIDLRRQRQSASRSLHERQFIDEAAKFVGDKMAAALKAFEDKDMELLSDDDEDSKNEKLHKLSAIWMSELTSGVGPSESDLAKRARVSLVKEVEARIKGSDVISRNEFEVLRCRYLAKANLDLTSLPSEAGFDPSNVSVLSLGLSSKGCIVALLASVLQYVDARVQARAQLSHAVEVTTGRMAKEQKRLEHYSAASVNLRDKLAAARAEFQESEDARKKTDVSDQQQIKALEDEEQNLLARLKVVRESIGQKKQLLEETRERNKRARISEKNKLHYAQKDIDTCAELLGTTQSNLALLGKLDSYVKLIEKEADLAIAATPLSNLRLENQDTSAGRQISSGQWRPLARVREWLDDERGEDSATLTAKRLVFEGMRVAKNMLQKFERNDSSAKAKSALDKVMSRCDIYSGLEGDRVGSPAKLVTTSTTSITAVLCDVRTLRHVVPKHMAERGLRVAKIMSRLRKLETRLNSCRSQQLSEAKAGTEMEVDGHGTELPAGADIGLGQHCQACATDVQGPDRGSSDDTNPAHLRVDRDSSQLCCLEMDEALPLPDCFWPVVSIVHSEKYVRFLEQRTKQLAKSEFKFITLKDDAVTADSDDELEFNKYFATKDNTSTGATVPADGVPKRMTRGTRSAQSEGDTQSSNPDVWWAGHKGSDDNNQSSRSNRLQKPKLVVHDDDNGSAVRHNLRRTENVLGLPNAVVEPLKGHSFGPLTCDYTPDHHQRVWLWDTFRLRRVSGNASPFYRNLRECIARNPHFIIYVGQDSKDDLSEDQKNIVRWMCAQLVASFVLTEDKKSLDNETSDGLTMEVMTEANGETGEGVSRASDRLPVCGDETVYKDERLSSCDGFGDDSIVADAETISVAEKIRLAGVGDGQDRISLWNTRTRTRLAGGNAPRRSQLENFLTKNPHYILYDRSRHRQRSDIPLENTSSKLSGDRQDQLLTTAVDKAAPDDVTRLVLSKPNKPIATEYNPSELTAMEIESIPIPLPMSPTRRSPRSKSQPGDSSARSSEEKFFLSEGKDESGLDNVSAVAPIENQNLNWAVDPQADRSVKRLKVQERTDLVQEEFESLTVETIKLTPETVAVKSSRSKSVVDVTNISRMVTRKRRSVEDDSAVEGKPIQEDTSVLTSSDQLPALPSVTQGILKSDPEFIRTMEQGENKYSTACADFVVPKNLEDEVPSGIGWWEALDEGGSDTFVSAESVEAATAAAAVVCRAVDAVAIGLKTGFAAVTDEVMSTDSESETCTSTEVIRNVFCCVRPPGHHAGRYGNTTGCSQNGFCLLNNVVIGAMYARVVYGFRRVAVIDIDAHFGNGTAELLDGDENAFYASVHLQYDTPRYFFPSSSCCTLGCDRSDPNCVLVNIYPPTRSSSAASRSHFRRGRMAFRSAVMESVLPALRAFQPDFIFISAGFDGSSFDPVGGAMGLRTEDFHWATDLLRKAADEMCSGRLISVLEGGYDIDPVSDALATSVEAHVIGLCGLSSQWVVEPTQIAYSNG